MIILQSSETLAVVREIANRMKDPVHVKNVILATTNKNPDPLISMPYWDDLSLAGGYPGLILLFSELDRLFPDENWDEVSHHCILGLKTALEAEGIHGYSLFGGLAGICFAVQQASRGGKRYQKLLNTLNGTLLKGVQDSYLVPLKDLLQAGKPIPATYYETIQGISGVGIYYLQMLPQEPFLKDLEEMIRLCILLTKPLLIEGKELPGWYLPNEHQFIERDKQDYPMGNFNLGLSHGLPGIVAFMSIALLHGIKIEGQLEAIEYATNWIKRKRKTRNLAYYWDGRIPYEEEILGENRGGIHLMDAWCYGTPGVARTLYLAGQALRDEELKKFALNSYRGIFKRQRQEWRLPGPTFCHGIAGLLTITLRMAQDTQDQELIKHTETLKNFLLDYYHPEYPLGFRDFEPTLHGRYVEVDKAGLLEGVAGVLLSLLSLNTTPRMWQLPFLIN